MSGKGRFIRNSLLFLLGSGLSKVLSIVMLPLYTSAIPTADYGAYDISLTYITIVSSFAYFELWSAVLRYMYDRDDADGKASVVRSGAELFCGATLLFVALGSALCGALSLGHPVWVVVYGVATAASTYMCFVARGCGKNGEFTFSGVLNSVVNVACNLLLILVLDFDYSALYISAALGSLVQSAYLAFAVRFPSLLRGARRDGALTRGLLCYAVPLCLNTAAYWLLSSAARLVYNAMCGDAASGVFSVGNKFGQIIVLATTCFTYAWQDLSFSETSKGAGGEFYSRACRQYLVFLTAALALMLPVVKLAFPVFVRGDYGDALVVVPLSLVVALASGYSAFVGNVFYAIKETKVIGISTVLAGVVSVGSSPMLIGLLGANGVNSAILLGFAVNVAVRAVVLRRKVGFDISPATLLACCGWMAASCVCYWGPAWLTAASFAASLALSIWLFKDDLGALVAGLGRGFAKGKD